MRIVFKDYLNKLAKLEQLKPPTEQRPIPKLEEIAEAAGVHPVTMSRIVNNQTTRLNLDIVRDTIAFMRQRGFATDVADFLVYEETPVPA